MVNLSAFFLRQDIDGNNGIETSNNGLRLGIVLKTLNISAGNTSLLTSCDPKLVDVKSHQHKVPASDPAAG